MSKLPKLKPLCIHPRAIDQYRNGQLVLLPYPTIERENPFYAHFIKEQTEEYNSSQFGNSAAFYNGARDFYSLWRAHCRAKRVPISTVSEATIEVLMRDLDPRGRCIHSSPIARAITSSYSTGLKFSVAQKELREALNRRSSRMFRGNSDHKIITEEVCYRSGFIDSWDVFNREHERQQFEKEFF